MHGVRLGDLMSVRSFLDHNRIYNSPIIDRPDAPVSSALLRSAASASNSATWSKASRST